jgi:hypothetical protein
MRNTHRPTGRFFCLLMVIAAPFLAVPAGMLATPPAASPLLTQVSDVVYRADGQAAKGTVLISWPAFTTADGSAVAAGSLSVQLGNGGAFSASLAPNSGAQPTGSVLQRRLPVGRTGTFDRVLRSSGDRIDQHRIGALEADASDYCGSSSNARCGRFKLCTRKRELIDQRGCYVPGSAVGADATKSE